MQKMTDKLNVIYFFVHTCNTVLELLSKDFQIEILSPESAIHWNLWVVTKTVQQLQ